jgi:hypothetical protein
MLILTIVYQCIARKGYKKMVFRNYKKPGSGPVMEDIMTMVRVEYAQQQEETVEKELEIRAPV